MKLTTKGRYAVTAMLDVALHDAAGPVALADIAERQQLSVTYLEQLFTRLRRRGLVTSMRGPGGGYRLSRSPEAISVADVISAVDESVDVTLCGGRGQCHQDSRCLTHDLWSELSAKLHEFLSQRSLADVLRRREKVGYCPALAARHDLGIPPPQTASGRRTVPIAVVASSGTD